MIVAFLRSTLYSSGKTLGLALFLWQLVGFAWADVVNISNAELAAIPAGDITIIDVRRPDEWQATGLIEGSHPVMFFDANGRYDVAAWLAAVDDIVSRDQPIALICARGVRSSNIANLLDRKLGFTNVTNVTGGMVSWVKKGRPVVSWQP